MNQLIRNFHLKKVKDQRNILDSALSYRYRRAETPIEFEERDLDRMMVNHIRHRCSNYNKQLRKLHRIDYTYNNPNYIFYKNNVLDRISKEYPYLSNECNNQKMRMPLVFHVRR